MNNNDKNFQILLSNIMDSDAEFIPLLSLDDEKKITATNSSKLDYVGIKILQLCFTLLTESHPTAHANSSFC